MNDSSLARRPALDGLRGVAVLAVLAYHLGLPGADGGFLGVDVFFVLSGFLIGSLLASELAATGRIDLPAFWARRARRLLPGLLIVSVAVAVWTHLSGDWETWGLRRDDLLATLGYVANWHLVLTDTDYFAATAGASPLLHTWSLAVEEQFYLLWPLLFLGVAWLSGRRRSAAVGVASALVLASAAASWLLFDPISPSRAYYGTDARIHQILIGVVLGLVLRPWRAAGGDTGGTFVRRHWLWAAQALLVVPLLAGFVFADPTAELYYRGGSLAMALVVAALILTLERAPDGPIARVLSARPMVWLGLISYGVYLWHWPVIVATAPVDPAADTLGLVPLRVGLSLGLAAAMFVLVERPIREGRLPAIRRRSWRTLAATAASLVLVGWFSVGATDLGSASAALLPGDDSAPVSVSGGDDAGLPPAEAPSTPGSNRIAGSVSGVGGLSRASSSAPSAPSSPTPAPSIAHTQAEIVAAMADFEHWQCPTNEFICTKVRGPSGHLTVVIFGDSSVGSLDVGMTEWAQSAGVTYIMAASGGCSPSGQPRSYDLNRVKHGPMDAKCEARYSGIVDQVAALPRPLLVLVSGVSENLPVVLPDGSIAPFGSAAQRNAVESGLDALIRRLDKPGTTVVMLGPAPHTLRPKCSGPGTGDCALSSDQSDWDAQAQVALMFQDVVSHHVGRAIYVRVDDLICPQGGPCASWHGDTLLRWDGLHYTRPGSRMMVAGIVKRLRTAGVQLQ